MYLTGESQSWLIVIPNHNKSLYRKSFRHPI